MANMMAALPNIHREP